MPVYGSSVLQNLSGSSSLTGAIGPIGSRGPTGPTGATGSTGPTGIAGISIISGPTGASGGNSISYFLEHEHGGEWITFSLTDGSTFGVSGARGETGSDNTNTNFEILNTIEDDYHGQIFSHIDGDTARFRNITVSGRDISIDPYDDYNIIIRGTTYDYGLLGSTGELLFQYAGLSAHGALNTNWDKGNYSLHVKIATHRDARTTKNIVDSWSGTGEEIDNNQTMVGSPDNEVIRAEGIAVPFEYSKKLESGIYESIVGIHLGMTSDDGGANPGSSADIVYFSDKSEIDKTISSSSSIS